MIAISYSNFMKSFKTSFETTEGEISKFGQTTPEHSYERLKMPRVTAKLLLPFNPAKKISEKSSRITKLYNDELANELMHDDPYAAKVIKNFLKA
ncbi:MAG: nucleic acid binding, variant 2, partial [Marteilia pararefringens]